MTIQSVTCVRGMVTAKYMSSKEKTFKDVIITPSRCTTWDWRDTVFDHATGYDAPRLKALIGKKKPDMIVLSIGFDSQINVSPSAEPHLRRKGFTKGKTLFICSTEVAVEKTNRFLKEGKNVLAFIHSTC